MSFDYPDKPRELKAPSQYTTSEVYWWTAVPVFVVLAVLTHVILLRFGIRSTDMSAMPAIGCWCISKAVAIWACRREGVSREESRQETILRSANAALAPHLSEAPVFELGRAKRPRIRIDRESFSGYSSGSAWGRIEWQDVGSCVVTTRRDVFGNPSYCFICLEGHQKFHTLFQMQLGQEDAPQVLAAIRFYLRGEEVTPQVLGGTR